jgi:hypothetical protein
MMSTEVVSQAHRTKIVWAPGDFAQGCAREGRMGGFDVEDNKADIPGGYSRADCVRERPGDGRHIGASEKDNPRVQSGSANHRDACHFRLQFAVSVGNAAAAEAVCCCAQAGSGTAICIGRGPNQCGTAICIGCSRNRCGTAIWIESGWKQWKGRSEWWTGCFVLGFALAVQTSVSSAIVCRGTARHGAARLVRAA